MTIDDLFTAYYVPIQHYLYNHLHDYELAEDTTQEVFILAYRALHTLKGGSAYPWLFTIAKRRCIDVVRRRNLVSFTGIEDWHVQEDPAAYCTDKVFAEHILSKLSPHYHTIILMLMEHCSYAEIAAQVGTTPTNVKMMIHRAREAAQEQYQQAIEEVAA